jgi:xanthine dehydrogenase large subunit
MFADREVVTVEGVATGDQLHPVQSCMVQQYGSQCGYCTPGFVMSMFEGFHRRDCHTHAEVADQLAGNLCRCTGYRPIRDAAVQALAERGIEDAHTRCLQEPVAPLPPLHYVREEEHFLRPTSLAQLLTLRRDFPDYVLVAGATEIGVLINKRYLRYPRLISTEGVAELRHIGKTADGWSLGAGATLTQIEEALSCAMCRGIGHRCRSGR